MIKRLFFILFFVSSIAFAAEGRDVLPQNLPMPEAPLGAPPALIKALEDLRKRYSAAFEELKNRVHEAKKALANCSNYCVLHYANSEYLTSCESNCHSNYEKTIADIQEDFSRLQQHMSHDFSVLAHTYDMSITIPEVAVGNGGKVTMTESSSSSSSDGSPAKQNDGNKGDNEPDGDGEDNRNNGQPEKGTVVKKTVNNHTTNNTTIYNTTVNQGASAPASAGKDYSGFFERILSKLDRFWNGDKGSEFKADNKDVPEPQTFDFSSFSVKSYFTSSGSCPAPAVVNLGIFGTMEIDYIWICRVAEYMRFVVIGFAWLSAVLIVVKGSRGS